MAKYVELEKLLNDICDSAEPFNKANVIKIICDQRVFNINNCEDCVFEEECDTHPMHCNSFMTVSEYWDKFYHIRR